MKHSRLLPAAAVGVLSALILAPAAAFAQDDATQYVGMGDSYASGHGAGDYDDSDCSRSANAYGPLLAAKLPADLNFVACSGAKIPDVNADQMPALSADTGLVTISVGGNDVGFSDIITTCTTGSDDTCIARIEEAEEIGRTQVAGELATLYADMATAAPNAQVIVVGYPKLFHEQECGSALGISVTEQ
ncbi:MAG: SGNH/GDSL hydrolase family protein, partial [Stackebrandtia sp.]